MSDNDETIKRLLESGEIAKRKLIDYLGTISDELFDEQMKEMSEEDIKSLHNWALMDEKYEVNARLQKYIMKKKAEK